MYVKNKPGERYIKYCWSPFNENVSNLHIFSLYFLKNFTVAEKQNSELSFWKSNHLESSAFTNTSAKACGSSLFTHSSRLSTACPCVCRQWGIVEAGTKKQTGSNPISVVNFLCGLGLTFCNCKEPYGYSYKYCSPMWVGLVIRGLQMLKQIALANLTIKSITRIKYP